jgi:hypothetical protein
VPPSSIPSLDPPRNSRHTTGLPPSSPHAKHLRSWASVSPRCRDEGYWQTPPIAGMDELNGCEAVGAAERCRWAIEGLDHSPCVHCGAFEAVGKVTHTGARARPPLRNCWTALSCSAGGQTGCRRCPSESVGRTQPSPPLSLDHPPLESVRQSSGLTKVTRMLSLEVTRTV